MSCKQCERDQEKLYRSLSLATGKVYVKYKHKNNVMFSSLDDYRKLKELGQIPENTDAEVLA